MTLISGVLIVVFVVLFIALRAGGCNT